MYIDFYYNGIGEKEEEMEQVEGVRNDEENVDGDSPAIVMYDSQYKPVASWVMASKSVTKGGPNDWVPKAMVKRLEEWGYGNKKVVLVSDGESSIVAVKNSMIAIREPETIP